MTDEERARMDAFARKMGHTRPEGAEHPAASAPPDAAGRKIDGAAEAQRKRESAAKAQLRENPDQILEQKMPVSTSAYRQKLKEKEKQIQQDAEQRAVKKTPPNKYENGFMLDLLILRNSLKAKAPRTLERLKQVNPYAARDLALALSLVDRLQLQLGETMPDSRIDYYSAMAQHGRYHLEIEGPVTPARVVLITDRQLGAVLDECIRNVCALCFKDGKEIDECPIRKAMLEVGPPERVREDGSGLGCEYRKVPGQLMRGEMVTV